jgi:two-component system CheB/CheR fusion protein
MALVDTVAGGSARTDRSWWRARSALRALVVDDNCDSRESLKLMLQLCGFRDVLEAIDASTALAIVRRDRPSIAVIEVALARVNGYELARRLRALRATDFLRLVALLGEGSPQSMKVAHAAGFDHVVVKPVIPEKLMEALESARAPALERLRSTYD